MKQFIDKRINEYREKVSKTFVSLQELIKQLKNEDLEKITEELAKNVEEPFMFVIVGEVKAGKSSFINALLQSKTDICKVAPSPMTDTIQQITYGKKEAEEINPYLKKIYEEEEILKYITIVDTPGTNTIISHHQEITERFIPSADLIVFVFEAKNPYRESSWDFFDYIHADWHKKTIFILQQKDLMQPADLKINMEGLATQAKKKGVSEPVIFAVSAKQEIEEMQNESGFIALREYLAKHITSGKTPYLKLLSSVTSGERIISRISEGINDRNQQYQLDIKFREEIKDILNIQESKSLKQVSQLNENLLNAYDSATGKRVEELKEGLALLPMVKKSFSSMFSKNKSIKTWLESVQKGLEQDLNTNLKDKLQEGVYDISDSIQDMGKMIDLKIKASKTILTNDHDIFSDIATKRTNVLHELQETFKSFLSRSENYYDEGLLKGSSIAPNLLTGGGIAVVGVIITAITNISVVDITGGIITAVGLIFAGFSIGFQKRKIVRKIKEEIRTGRDRIKSEISIKLTTYISKIKTKIDNNFDNFDQLLAKEKTAIESLKITEKEIVSELKEYKTSLEKEVK